MMRLQLDMVLHLVEPFLNLISILKIVNILDVCMYAFKYM